MMPTTRFLAVACVPLGWLFLASSADAQPFNDTLQYDERGNLVRLNIDGRVTDYRYDGMDRLRAEGTPGNQVLGLDADGNRLSDGRSRYRVVPDAQRLADRDGLPMVHGPTGQLLSERAWLGGRWVQREFVWNLAGQLSEVKVNGAVVAVYSYNALGQRTRKTLASPPAGMPAVTLYRYDPAGQLVLEVAGSAAQGAGVAVVPGQVLVRYFWHDETPAAIAWPAMTPGNPNSTSDRLVHLHTDHLNTPRRATDSRGRVVWSWARDAFGSTAPNEDVDNDGRLTSIHLRFPGQYHDVESGLHYNWHRYYDPQVGRYTQSDPIGLAGGLNTYAYANGAPTMNTDPMGLFLGPWHTWFSSVAMRDSGFDERVASRVAGFSTGADWIPGSQATWNAHWHAMCTINVPQSECQRRYGDYLEQQISTCTAAGLGRAMHAAQDSAARGHAGWQYWAGGIPSMEHLRGDSNPTGLEQATAIARSKLIIRRFRSVCTCTELGPYSN